LNKAKYLITSAVQNYKKIFAWGQLIKSESISSVELAQHTEISDKKIQKGLRLTLQFFNKMNTYYKQNKIQFAVVIIPTKEMAYSHYLYNNHNARHSKAINNLLNNERIIREISIRYFLKNRIKF